MAEPRSKTLTYHRAEYAIERPDSIRLAACLREALIKRPTVSQRSVDRGGGQFIRIAKSREDPTTKDVYLHLTMDTPGERASVVPRSRPESSEVSVSTVTAPNGTEFMDGDAFVYVHGNNVCLCMTGLRSGTVAMVLQDFLKASEIRRDASHFSLVNALNVDAVALMEKTGVKEIELQANMYSASAEYSARKLHTAGVLGSISKTVRALLGSEHDVTEDALRVILTLRLDKRMKGTGIGYKRLGTLARDIFSNQKADDEFTIVLKDGKKIRPEEIFMNSGVTIEALGKSVDRDLAWGKLREYYLTLQATGALGR